MKNLSQKESSSPPHRYDSYWYEILCSIVAGHFSFVRLDFTAANFVSFKGFILSDSERLSVQLHKSQLQLNFLVVNDAKSMKVQSHATRLQLETYNFKLYGQIWE